LRTWRYSDTHTHTHTHTDTHTHTHKKGADGLSSIIIRVIQLIVQLLWQYVSTADCISGMLVSSAVPALSCK